VQDVNTISLRFKHGVHTIFLFVDPLETFSVVTQELLAALRIRYPNGLTPDLSLPDRITDLPSADEPLSVVHYATLVDQADTRKGWRNIHVRPGTDTPVGKRLKSNDMLAFAFAREDEEPDFVVGWPTAGEDGDDIMEQSAHSKSNGRNGIDKKALTGGNDE
jgi:hypothetical protein